MVDIFRKKTKALLGIDISSSSVKVLELSKSGSRYKVENYARRDLPDDAVVEKNINDVEVVGDVLYKLSTAFKSTIKDSAVAVSGSAVITKLIELNASLSDAEMENQIAVEADQYIPYPLDEVSIDFDRQQMSTKSEDMVDVLLAACKKENVDSRVAVLDIGGFKAKVVDIEAYAMERVYKLLLDQMSLPLNDIVAIIDLGSTMLTLYILRDGISIYTREQAFGGAQLANEVQNRYGMEAAEAEAAIIEDSLPPEYEADVLVPFRDGITEQISSSLQFFFSSSQYNDVDLIILAGGTASTKGLAEHVEQNLSCRSIVANPFERMSVGSNINKAQLENDAASLLIATGLAMRGF